MTLFQAILLGLFGWMTSIYGTPLLGGLGGWYTFGRPLVSGLVIGIILGDVAQGIILGAAIQMLYIGLVTPGGSMPADVNFAAWIGIPLAMCAGAGTEYALGLAVPLSFLGVAATYSVIAINLVFVHEQDKAIEQGKLTKAGKIPVYGQITNFALRFFPIMLINYFGADLVSTIVQSLPAQVNDLLMVFANMLPIVGFTILLQMIVKNKFDLIYWAFGFVLVTMAGFDMITIVIIAAVIAYITYTKSKERPEKEA